MARSKKLHKRAAACLALAALAAGVTFGTLAQADVTSGDSDGDTPVAPTANPAMNFNTTFGTICVGQTYNRTILVAVRRLNGTGTADVTSDFQDGATVTLSFNPTVENPPMADLTESITDSAIVLPGNWESLSDGAMSDVIQGEPVGTGEIAVSLTPTAPTGGQVETTLQYRTIGPNADDVSPVVNTNARGGSTKIQWNAVNCDTDPPDVTGSVGTPSYTDGGGNQFVTSATTLDFDVDETTNGGSFPLASCTVSADGPTTNDDSFTCAEGNNNYTLSTATPMSFASTPPDGSYLNSASAKDSLNNEGTDSFTVILDNTAPTFGSCTGGPYTLGSGNQAVSITADDGSGSGVDNGNSTLSGTVDTSTPGTKTVNYEAKDNLGNTSTTSCDYEVQYTFAGFFAPVDNLPTFNKVKAGQGIPVKFSLGGDQGLDIFAPGYPKSTRINCPSETGQTDTLESTVTAGNSSLSYDALANQYVYVWKSIKDWANTCRRLDVELDDGTTHSANFWFTK